MLQGDPSQMEDVATAVVESSDDNLLDGDLHRIIEAKIEFQINSRDAANWLIMKVKQWRAYRARIDQWYEQEKRRAAHNEDFLLRRYEGELRYWAVKEIAALGARTKSLNLPAGRIGFRRVHSKLVVDDERLVLDWARQNCPEAVQQIEKLSRSVVTEHFKTTGEMPSTGAHVESEHESFSLS